MFKTLFRCSLAAVFYGVLTLTNLPAQESSGVVIMGEKHADPKLLFIPDQSPNAQHVARNLNNCGWFEMVRSGTKSDYIISMSSSGDTITLTLKNGAGVRIADFYGRSFVYFADGRSVLAVGEKGKHFSPLTQHGN